MEVCRLCLDLQSDNTFSSLEGTSYKDMVQVVAPELNLEISNAPIVCNECCSNLDELFAFKSKCFENEAQIRPKCEGKKSTFRLKEILDGNTNADGIALKIENTKDRTCRTCLGPIECESFTILKPSESDAYLDSMLTMCLPEIDLELTKDPVICESCMDNLQKLHHFKSTCLDIEDKLTTYCETQKTNPSNQINLNSVLESEAFKMEEDDSGFANIKSEQFKTESEDTSMKSENDSEMTGDTELKQEEIDIKSEAGTSGSDNDGRENVREEPDQADQVGGGQQWTITQLKYHVKIKDFACTQCSFRTSRKATLCNHIKIIHDKVKDLACSRCSFETWKQAPQIFKRHKPIHNIKDFTCPQCPYRSIREIHIKRHIKSVHERDKLINKLKDFTCPQCPYKTIHEEHLKRHIKSVHDKIKDFACPHCPHKTSAAGYLKQHIKCIHKYVRADLACTRCSFKTWKQAHLKEHVKAVHEQLEEFGCTKCSYRTSRKADLKIHVKAVHDQLKYFACTKCSFRTFRNRLLNLHVKKGHDRLTQFTCSECTYTTSSQRDLKIHLKNVHGLLLKCCTKCSFKSVTPHDMSRHIEFFHKKKSNVPKNH